MISRSGRVVDAVDVQQTRCLLELFESFLRSRCEDALKSENPSFPHFDDEVRSPIMFRSSVVDDFWSSTGGVDPPPSVIL